MEPFRTLNPRFEEQGRAAFARQAIMASMGARLVGIAPGRVEIELDFREDLTQHHGYLHAGVVTTICDSACGFAAFTLMPPDSGVLTVEYKVNFASPAKGTKFLASGRVIRPGRTLTVCAGEVVAIDGHETKLVALMQATMIRMRETGTS
jgi:uncharacterized protein (TIGR00369 family)